MGSRVRCFIVAAGLFLTLAAFALPPAAHAVAPDVRISVSANVGTADPNDLVTFTISVDNRGPQSAPSVWVNDTLPAGTAYFDDTANTDIGSPVFQGRSFSGNVARFQFANFPASNRSFDVRARVGLGVTDRQILQDIAALWYANATGVAQPTASASASVTVSIPVLGLAKSGAFTAPDAITYTITVSNTGSASAKNLWWNDSLPAGVLYAGIRPVSGQLRLACTNSGPWVNCVSTVTFAPGSKAWYIDVTIPAPLPPASTITNWVFANYTDSDGTQLSEVRTSAPLTIATASIQAVKIADATRVPPGGTIGYTIFYNDTGQIGAGVVWLNDTLPQVAGLPAVTVVSATPTATVQTQASVKWQFTNVATGAHFVTLVVRVLPAFGDGTILVNTVTGNYTDANGNARPGSQSAFSTTVSVNVPAIEAKLVADRASVEPGGSVGLVLYYNNTRPALAAYVVIEMILPSGLPLSSVNPIYNWTLPGKLIWNLTSVTAGSHEITLTATVPTNAASGTLLRTTAFANYTDDRGTPVGGSQTSAEVTVHVSVPAEAPPYALIAGGVIAAVVGSLVVLRLYLASIDSTVIDEVFLLHRDGLLIKHYTRRLKPDVDSDILSGMLIAVQNFVNESFIGEAGLKKEGQLDEMKFGQYRILLIRGQYVVVAAVISGPKAEKVPAQIRAAIEDLEGDYGTVLATWDGNMDVISGADRFMQDLIAGNYRSPSKVRRRNH